MKLRDQAQGAELGVPSLKTLEARVKFHSKNLQPDRPQFPGGKQDRKEFQEGTRPSVHWGGAREEEKHTCSRSAHYKGGGCTCLGYLSNVSLWNVRIAPVMESRHLRSLFTDPQTES